MPLPMLADQRLSLCVCSACGVEYAIPTKWEVALRENHATFYCPAGHSQYFPGETDAEKLRKLNETLTKRLEFARNDTEAQRRLRERAERRAAAARGQTTKIKNRLAKGQCPCCRQKFTDLAAHMESKHPDYTEAK